AKLFHTIHTQGNWYSTAVATTYGAIMKPPSPTTETQGRSGAANCAPRTLQGPNPIEEYPQLLSMLLGRRGSQNCMNQLWCTPESNVMITSSGNVFCNVPTTYSGRIGVVIALKFGSTNLRHSSFHAAISSRHCAKFSR